MRGAGFKSLDPLVLSLMGTRISADGCDLLSAFKRHVNRDRHDSSLLQHVLASVSGECLEEDGREMCRVLYVQEQGYACGYATCTLEGNGQALSPSPQARRAERVRWLR